MAAGNPLIALLAHRVACSRRGLHGLAFNDLLSEYARSAVATAVGRRDDVQADDLHDVLALVAALGRIGPSDTTLISSLLGLPVRTVRHRIDDLADAGLLTASGEQLAISPDLLAAHLLHQSHLSGRHGTGVRYAEIWETADEDRRGVMCSALGALQGFDVAGGSEVSALVGDALVDLAATQPARALTRAQSAAPGLPDLALRTVDAAITALPEDVAVREKALLVAMDVLSCVSDVSAGGPRQLTVAQAYFAIPGTEAAAKKIHDALTDVYTRLPVNTSAYDGHVLAHVQDVLAHGTIAHWEEHRNERGCAPAIATAAEQLLMVMAERSYASAEDPMTINLRAGFLPAGERTARVLRAGSRLLRESLRCLPLDMQQSAVQPIAALRRTALGATGPFGALPPENLVTLASQVIDEMTHEFAELDQLPLPTRAALIDALGSDPWPDDNELRRFRELLRFPPARERLHGEGRAEREAAALLAADDLVAELDRWQTWVALAETAGMRHAAQMVVGSALACATSTDPERMAPALETVLAAGGTLSSHAAAPLAELVSRPGGELLMRRLLIDAPPATRAAVAGGLRGTSEDWADVLLEELVDDEDDRVRWAIVSTAGWTQGGSARRLHTGLRACLPAGIAHALSVLSGTSQRAQDEHLLPLDADAASLVAQLAANAAREPHMQAYELVELGQLAELRRLVIDTCRARVRWLAENPAENLDQTISRDGLPDKLASPARAGAEDRDRAELMDFLEDPSVERQAAGEAIRLLGWIDDHDVVTDRLGRWLASNNEQLQYYASEMLRQTRDPAQFKERARALLALDPPLDLTDALLDAREPMWLLGSEKVV